MRNFIAFIVIASLLALGVFAILPGSPFLPGNNPEAARATAQADYLARSEPLSGDEYVAVHGMDKIADVAKAGFDSNVQIAVSADTSQTALGQMICAAAWAPAAFVVALAALYWLVTRKKEQPRVSEAEK